MFEEWNISTQIFFENLTLSTETEHSILEFMSDSLKFQKLPKEADSFLGFQITFWVFLTWRCVFAVTKLGFLRQRLDESSSLWVVVKASVISVPDQPILPGSDIKQNQSLSHYPPEWSVEVQLVYNTGLWTIMIGYWSINVCSYPEKTDQIQVCLASAIIYQ